MFSVKNSSAKFSPLQRWKKVAISHMVDRYVLDVSKYELPYYEVKWIGHSGDSHEVYFVLPGDLIGPRKEARDLIDDSNPYAPGPYHDHIKAIKGDAKKRGLPTEIEGVE